MSGSTLYSSRSRLQTTNVNPAKLMTDILRLHLQQDNLYSTGCHPQLVKQLTDHLDLPVPSTRAAQHCASRPSTPNAGNSESQQSEKPDVTSDSEPSTTDTNDPFSSDSNTHHPPCIKARCGSPSHNRRRHSSPKSSHLDLSSEANIISNDNTCSSESATTI